MDNFIVLQNSHGKITVNPQGGQVIGWEKINEKTGKLEPVLYRGSNQKRTGIPILFPQFSKSAKVRSHGFGRDSLWRVLKTDQENLDLELTDKDIAPDAKAEYPYAFKVNILIQLTAEGNIVYTLKVFNPDNQPLPIVPGLHPYFAVNHNHKSGIIISGISGFDATRIDWDNHPPDNVYDYQGKITLHLKDKQITIEDITPGNKPVKHIVVWSQPKTSDDFNFICVEPVCGQMYDLDNQPVLIKPGEKWEMIIQFKIENLTISGPDLIKKIG
jgi:galactose mutarotase-like enzyme